MPPPLEPPPDLDRRVRSLAAPFLERQIWIVGFCVVGALQSVYDLIRGQWASLLLDVAIVAALASLWRSMQSFRQAGLTGKAPHLAKANDHLVRYVRFTVILGFGGLALMVVAIGALVWALTHGTLQPGLLKEWAHG